MNRTLENVWGEFIVQVFIERFLLVVCATVFYGMVISNNMNFDSLQRIGLGFALIGAALFLGATVHKQTHPPPPLAPPTPAIPKAALPVTTASTPPNKDALNVQKVPAEKPVVIPPGASITQTTNAPCSQNAIGNNNQVNCAPPPRTIRSSDRDTVIGLLKTAPGTIIVGEVSDNVESHDFAEQWNEVLKEAGWKVKDRMSSAWGPPLVGALIEIHGEQASVLGEMVTVPKTDPAAVLGMALQRAGVSQISMHRNPSVPAGEVRLHIGLQPTAQVKAQDE